MFSKETCITTKRRFRDPLSFGSFVPLTWTDLWVLHWVAPSSETGLEMQAASNNHQAWLAEHHSPFISRVLTSEGIFLWTVCDRSPCQDFWYRSEHWGAGVKCYVCSQCRLNCVSTIPIPGLSPALGIHSSFWGEISAENLNWDGTEILPAKRCFLLRGEKRCALNPEIS